MRTRKQILGMLPSLSLDLGGRGDTNKLLYYQNWFQAGVLLDALSPSLPKTPFLINIYSLTPISQSYLIDFIYARCQNDIVVLENIF